MFESNCLVIVPAPEISLKSGPVRAFMLSKLKKNIMLYFRHAGVGGAKINYFLGRLIVNSKNPKKALDSIKACFGIHSLFEAKLVEFNSLQELVIQAEEITKGNFASGTFAVRGKSNSPAFSSKELEMALGAKLIELNPSLKVKLKSPDKELYCITQGSKAIFYFGTVKGAGGMPVGVQGFAGLLVDGKHKKNDLEELVKSLLKTGCGVHLVGENNITLPKAREYNCFKDFKILSIKDAQEAYNSKTIMAFFSAAWLKEAAEMDSKLLGIKVFAPLLLG